MPLAFHHLAVVAQDLALAEGFYVGVLGLTVIRRWDDEHGKHRSTWVALGGECFLAIERAAAVAPKRVDDAPGLHCLALRIPREEREQYRARLTKAGVPIVRESEYTLYSRDPDGTLVGLSHYPDLNA